MDMMESGQAPQLPLAGDRTARGVSNGLQRGTAMPLGRHTRRHVADQRCQLHRTVVVAMATMVATMPSFIYFLHLSQ
jgi:hypothetical protein